MHKGDAEHGAQQAGNQGKVALPGLGEPCKQLLLDKTCLNVSYTLQSKLEKIPPS